MKKCEKVPKSVKYYETILPFSCCPLVFPRDKDRARKEAAKAVAAWRAVGASS